MKCKVIRTQNTKKTLESDINAFLSANPGLNIKHITQCMNQAGIGYTSIFYED